VSEGLESVAHETSPNLPASAGSGSVGIAKVTVNTIRSELAQTCRSSWLCHNSDFEHDLPWTWGNTFFQIKVQGNQKFSYEKRNYSQTKCSMIVAQR